MEASYRLFSGILASVAALFSPIAPLILSTGAFIAVDFLTGIAADRARSRRKGERWYFESRKAWNTIRKLGLALVTIALAWILEHYVLQGFMATHLTRIFTGFICGVELWSFLENASELSDAPVFRFLRRYARRHIGDKLRN